MLTTFHPASSNHIFHYNVCTVIFLPPVFFPHKGYRNCPCKIRVGWVRDPNCAIHKKGCDSWDLAWDPQSRVKPSTSCTEQCHNTASRGNTFFSSFSSSNYCIFLSWNASMSNWESLVRVCEIFQTSHGFWPITASLTAAALFFKIGGRGSSFWL